MFESRVISNGVLNGGFYRLDLNEFVSFRTEPDNSLSPYVRSYSVGYDKKTYERRDSFVLPIVSKDASNVFRKIWPKLI